MTIGLIIIGCVTGFISAFFGIGGSSIDTPLLKLLFNFDPYLALGTPLPLTLITIIFAFFAYKKSLINFKIAIFSLSGGIPGIIIGSYFSQYFPGKFLMILTSLTLFFIGFDFIYKLSYENRKIIHNKKTKGVAPIYIFSLSFFISFFSGILANGGGIFFVPLYTLFFKMKIKEAIATSLFTIGFMSLPAIFIHYYLGHIDLTSTAKIGIGVAPMAYLGAKLDLHVKSRTIEFCFGVLLIVFSLYFFINQLFY